MNSLTQLSVVIGLSVAAAGATWLANGRPLASEPKIVRCDRSLLKEGEICLKDVPENVLWIDARSREEWTENGLSGSVLWNLDPGENAQEMEAAAMTEIFGTKAPIIIVYCSSEACGTSRIIADRISALGLGPPVKILHGGWDAVRVRDSS